MNQNISPLFTRTLLALCATNSALATPLLAIAVVTKAPNELPQNRTAEAVYQITNNTHTLNSFVMKPIQGVTQITTTTGACAAPITLSYGQSCLLNLRIRGNEMPASISGGPVVCNNVPNPMGCSQPTTPADNLSITRTADEIYTDSNTWINVLIANYEPTTDLNTYVNKIYTLAPLAEQIHIRINAGAHGCSASNPTSCQPYVDLIAKLRSKYTNPLLIGYHPDDSRSSYSDWGCTQDNWSCVLNASIVVMNAINALASPHNTGDGFNIFSLEQSYAPPSDAPTLRNIKACLNPPEATTGGVCPAGVTIASPYVSMGWVLSAYDGCPVPPDPQNPCDNVYGTDALDYGYPQYYNLGPKIAGYTNLITNGFLPSYTTGCINNNPYPNPLYVVDEDNGAVPYNPQIPCPASDQTTSNVFTYPDPSTGAPPNLSVATAYLAYIMTQLPPISDIPNVNGATVYITFSGEGPAQAPSFFLGTPGWTLSSILQFYTGINANFNVLYQQYPPTNDPLFRNGIFAQGVKPNAIKYAIWNFSSILDNMPG